VKIQKSAIAGLRILSSIYKVKILKRRIPLYCEWEVTNRCNMSCSMCSTRIKEREPLGDTSTKEALAIVDELGRMGTKIIHFSGGEPTLREDLTQLISRAKEKNMLVSITTNGSAPLEKIQRLLDTDLIRVSIDGPEQFHDWLRQSRGAFKRAIDTLRFLRSRKVRPLITAVYTPDTTFAILEELSQIAQALGIQMAINVLGRNVNDNAVNHSGALVNDLTRPIFKDYINAVHKLKKKYGSLITNPQPLLQIIEQGGLDAFGCRAMDIAVAIKHDGSLNLPCNGLSIKSAKGDLKGIYYGSEAEQLRALQGRHRACKGCYIKCMSTASGLLRPKALMAIMDSFIGNLL
jgi:MoaA/NifB/PqqE/SkfB family radical SAM enzyme